MTVITNLNKVAAILDGIGNSPAFKDVNVVVGYTAAYALHVHENRKMRGAGKPRPKPKKGFYWDPQGKAQAKFLEQPARELQPEIGRIILTAFKKTMNLKTSLLMGGLFLQRESMKLVPIDIGNLRGSAFTKAE